jgi:hypothetical protein
MSQTPQWTVAQARAARLQAEQQHAPSPWRRLASLAMPVWSRAFATIAGVGIYQRRMQLVANHMNRNRDAFEQYTPGAGDVVVSAYFKAGTNWIMHTCHQICHLGAAEFDHIQDVIPWPDAAQPRFWVHVNDRGATATPTGQRVIKSHLAADHIPVTAAARYIAVTRDPKDCAASAYHFFRDLVFGSSMPPPDVWLRHFMSERPSFGRWDAFTASWYKQRHHPQVLFLTFEEVKADNLAAIRRIAAFMDVELSEQQLDKVVRATSFSAMQAIDHKFYPARQSARGHAGGKMVRKGEVGGARQLFSGSVLQEFDQHWIDGLTALESEFPYREHYGVSTLTAGNHG